MKKLFDKIKKNNKGFTLVELIVVIAILAIITVVVAPQYLSYVEKSKEGTDANAAGEMAHAAEIAYIEASVDATLNGGSLTVGKESHGYTYAEGTNTLESNFAKICPSGSYKFVSKKYANGVTITISAAGKATAAPTAAAAGGGQ